MAKGAAEVLGTPEVAGTFVSPHGMTKKMTGIAAAGAVGGVVGGMIGMAAAGPPFAGAPPFGAVGYVALTEHEIVLIRGKPGALKPKVGTEVVARAPRAAVASAALERGTLKADLRIEFADGGLWAFEIPKIYRATAERVVAALSGRLAS